MGEKESNKYIEIDGLLKNIFNPSVPELSLKDLFVKRLHELKVSPTQVLDILNIERRTLHGILEGTQKRVDFTNLIKIANFLQLPKEQIIKLYLDLLEKNFPSNNVTSPDKIKFIKENFDLVVLKKSGFIDSLTDFGEIEQKIVARLCIKSIFEYSKPPMDIAFSSGASFKPKNALTRSFWIAAARACFEEINNPNEYDKQGLLDFFPQIRWHSTDVEHGLLNVIKHLYKFGVTVIYQPPLHTLQLRGATFSVNDKPCIVLTNYMGFYGTLWFALIHELLHVIFDWNEIKNNSYHLTDDSNDQLSVKEKEAETNKYAREYLFSEEKTKRVRPFLNDFQYVKEFAMDNHVHTSLIYTFNAFDTGSKDRMAWARARRQDADISESINPVDIPWDADVPFDTIIKKVKFEIYN